MKSGFSIHAKGFQRMNLPNMIHYLAIIDNNKPDPILASKYRALVLYEPIQVQARCEP